MNRVILCGNLTRDVELSTTGNGVSFAKFTLAVSREYKTEGGQDVDYINILAWRNTAENCAKYTGKGSKLIVEGSIQVRSYETEKGEKRQITEVVATRVEFVGQRKDVAQGEGKKATGAKQLGIDDMEEIDDDDLPF